MKNKRIIAVLLAVALIQLLFPVGFIACENRLIDTVIEKGGKYTLKNSYISHMNKSYMYINTEELYRVEERYASVVEHKFNYGGWIGSYSMVGVETDEKGDVNFYDTDDLSVGATDYNRLKYNYNLFYLYFENYEFVNPDFGLKELAELGILLCEDEVRPIDSYEEFMYDEGYIGQLYQMPLDGKVTLCVYKDYAVVSELYIGDELILRHK